MTTRNKPRAMLDIEYSRYAREYLESLPLEHFMESTAQNTQRKITDASLELVRAQRPDVHLFGELLVQFPIKGKKRPGQIVPDNMVVLHNGPIEADTHYTLLLQPVRPFWVMEYVSKGSERKDYGASLEVYEKQLRVPYYLVFYPEHQEMTLFRLNSRHVYRAVVPDDHGRCAIPDLHLEVGLRERWVRFWYQGRLLPLPGELDRQLQATQQELIRTQSELTRAQEELAQARAELARLRGTPPGT